MMHIKVRITNNIHFSRHAGIKNNTRTTGKLKTELCD